MIQIPSKEELIAARTKLFKYVHYTPVFKSSALDELSGAQLYFKAENLQKMGAFKMRGAMHACLSLSETQLKKGIATHSSGNFAQALSLAANKIGIEAYIVMPENAPQVKKNAVNIFFITVFLELLYKINIKRTIFVVTKNYLFK